MARGAKGQVNAPPVADYRRKVGRQHEKAGKKETAELQSKALARRNDPEFLKLLIGLLGFGIFCCLLYLYLQYVADDDELDAEAA